MTTAEALEAMTDTSAFERFAMSALRELEPEFASIRITGMNAQNKTIRHPLDGFGRLPGSHTRYGTAAVTTSQDLKGKWLAQADRDFADLSGDAGDLVKAARKAAALRVQSPNAQVRVALLTNREVKDEVHLAVDAYALRHNLEYEILSRGRLADYLDNTANGNYHRATLFGTLQRRLSWELLRDIATASLDLFAQTLQASDVDPWIDEQYEDEIADALSRKRLAFLVASSGRGKSTVALRFAHARIAAGGVALWCRPEIFEPTVSLERALLTVLQSVRPQLDELAGQALLAFAATNDVVLLIDDVNRLADPVGFCDRLTRLVGGIAAAPPSNDKAGRPNAGVGDHLGFLVPVWPTNTGALLDIATPAHVAVVSMEAMDDRHAVELVSQIRAMHPLVAGAADPIEVAAALWNDPFLIATWARLWERTPEPPLTDVLHQYVDTQCEQAAIAAGILPAEVSRALQYVADFLLQTRCLRPTIVETLEQLPPAAQNAFRALLRHQRIARADSAAADARLAFAHDRLRDFVLSSTLVRTGAFVAPAEATLRDPLFAEVFALAARAADMTGLARLVFANPLSGAIAVSESTPLDPERKREIERLLTQWWNNPATAALGEHQAARAFARDWWATHATPLSAILDRESVGTPVYLAGSRMGSAAHAVVLCANLGFDTNASWRDAAIFAGDRRRGSTLRAELRRMLEGDLGNDDARRGALWLAGFLGDPTLLDGVRTCWQRVEQKTVILKAAAYAVARTSTDLIRDMEPLLDYWETIDDARDEHNASPRYWATHNIPYLLAETKHPQLLAWVAHVAARRPGLKRVAHEIAIRDFSAEAVPIIIAHYEETERERSEDGERIALWQLMMDRDHGRSDPLPTALAALKGLFLDPGVAPLRRKFAFHLWAPSATVSDLSDLRDIPEPDVFGDSLLTVRLGLADYEAADELVGKLNSRAQIEWWLRYCADLWAHVAVRGAFEACLDRQIEGFAPADPAQIFPGDDVDYTLAGELNQIAPAEVERILVPRWAHVSTRTRYLQAALAADTPQLTRLFTERIATAANPTQAFEHISIRAEGRRERPIRFAALTPFLRYAGPMELTLIAFEADRQSHHAWRVEHVEPLLDEQTREKFGSSDSDWLRRFQRDFQHPHGVEHWLRTLESAGEPPWRAISLLRDWFLASHDSAAFAGYNHAVRVNGSREDVDRLLAECPPGQAENVAFTRYVVHRRTGYLTTAVQSR